MNCKGSTTRGNATISQRIERRVRVKRMSGKGGAMSSSATPSQGKQKANGRWEVGGGGGASRGRGMPRG
jgi:hypothetical protein